MTPLERIEQERKENKLALKIIKKKGLDFSAFRNTFNPYEYNISREKRYHKLLASEYFILRKVIKGEK